MKKRLNGEQTDTVSISGSERVIYNIEKETSPFDYTVFCKNVMKTSKRKMDACLLVPLKFYHDEESCVKNIDYIQLDEWMSDFSTKKEDFFFVWLYIAYENGYKHFEQWCRSNIKHKNIELGAINSAKIHAGDVTKLEKTNYIKKLCEKRDITESWILNIYEITLKKIYKISEMALLIQDIIKYLNQCDFGIQRPVFVRWDENEKLVFQTAANLMLLVTRVRLGISVSKSVEWYRKCNVAYSLYIDQMLDEYIHLVNNYYYHSYERFVKMSELSMQNKNKYAAKEVGDIYNIGAELQDIHGNKILIQKDKEKACDFYRISMEHEYIPAYISAVKTDCLIDPDQKKKILLKALEEKNSEALAFCAEADIFEAEKCVKSDMEKALLLLQDAVTCILSMEDDYAEKYVIRNSLVLSKCFNIIKTDRNKYREIACRIQRLFSCDVFSLTDEEMSREIENGYLSAGKLGYFEAEYKLGKYFQKINITKSRQYIVEGKEKGCKYCMLEYAIYQEENNQEEWLSIMLSLGENYYDDTMLLVMIAKEWIKNENFFEKVKNEILLINLDKILKIYLQISNMIQEIDKREAINSEKVKILSKLYDFLNELKNVIGERLDNQE